MAKAKAKTAGDIPGKTVRVVTETVEHHEEAGGELPLDDLPEATPDEDSDALAELEALAGTGARFEIRRTAPAGFTGYVGTYMRDVFTPDLLQSEWGGGNFTLRVKNSKGEYVGSRQIVLAGEAHNKRVPAAPVAPVASAGDNGTATMLAAMQKSSEAQVTMLTSLVTALINKPAPAPVAPPDPIAMIAALKGIMKPESSEGGAVKMLLQGIELGKSLGESGGETNIMDLVGKGFDTIKEAAALAPPPAAPVPARRLAAPVAAAPNNPSPNNAPAPGTVPAQEAAPMSDQMKQVTWLRQQAGMLVRLAAQNKDAELYAEVFLDNLPPFVPAQLVYDTMVEPGAVAKLAMLVPQVSQYGEWFEKFRATVVELLEDTGDDEGETDPHVDDVNMGAAPAGEPPVDSGEPI